MHLHKQKLTKYFRGHYIIMVGVTNFKELGVTFSCSVFAAFFWELPKNFPHVWLRVAYSKKEKLFCNIKNLQYSKNGNLLLIIFLNAKGKR